MALPVPLGLFGRRGLSCRRVDDWCWSIWESIMRFILDPLSGVNHDLGFGYDLGSVAHFRRLRCRGWYRRILDRWIASPGFLGCAHLIWDSMWFNYHHWGKNLVELTLYGQRGEMMRKESWRGIEIHDKRKSRVKHMRWRHLISIQQWMFW